MLFLTKKGKEGEGIEFTSINDIQSAFLKDVGAELGINLTDVAPEMPPAEEASASVKPSMETVAQMKSLGYQASKAGFEVGGLVTKKKADEAKKNDEAKDVYKVQKLSDDGM